MATYRKYGDIDEEEYFINHYYEQLSKMLLDEIFYNNNELAGIYNEVNEEEFFKPSEMEFDEMDYNELEQEANDFEQMVDTLSSEDVHKIQGTTIKRKIFSQKDEKLLCVLNYIDFNKLEIKFTEPEKIAIKNFVNLILKDAFIKIKETNPNIKISYQFSQNKKLIELITIHNLNSIANYDILTAKIRELLSSSL